MKESPKTNIIMGKRKKEKLLVSSKRKKLTITPKKVNNNNSVKTSITTSLSTLFFSHDNICSNYDSVVVLKAMVFAEQIETLVI